MAMIYGNNKANRLNGTSQHDEFWGYGGNDTISAGGGDDWIRGGFGSDQIDGGTGAHDTAIYDDSTEGVTVDLALGRGYWGTAAGDTLVNIEDVGGSNYNDVLIGNSGDNYLSGLAGDDRLIGRLRRRSPFRR